MTAPARIPQLFDYYGSKARLAPVIAAALPEGTRRLVSPFMGSGVFEYNYAAAHPECRVVCYDLDPAIVNIHRQALARRLALRARILELHARLVRRRPMDRERYLALLAEHRAARQSGVLAAAR